MGHPGYRSGRHDERLSMQSANFARAEIKYFTESDTKRLTIRPTFDSFVTDRHRCGEYNFIIITHS